MDLNKLNLVNLLGYGDSSQFSVLPQLPQKNDSHFKGGQK